MKLLTAILAISVASAYAQKHSQRKPGDPLKDLPPNIEVLTHFGERADISPDNQRVAFMAKSFGDAMLVDLKTRAITCLTCNVPGASFLRVMHLITGDYILIGPERFEDIHTSRSRDNELWFLSKERGSKPVKLRQKMSEGAAISKKSLKVAFSELPAQNPELAPGTSRLMTAELDLSEALPSWLIRRPFTRAKTEAAYSKHRIFMTTIRRWCSRATNRKARRRLWESTCTPAKLRIFRKRRVPITNLRVFFQAVCSPQLKVTASAKILAAAAGRGTLIYGS